MTGWICPRCSRCYAPHIAQCWECGPATVTTTNLMMAIGPCGFYQPGNSTSGNCKNCGHAQYAHLTGGGVA